MDFPTIGSVAEQQTTSLEEEIDDSLHEHDDGDKKNKKKKTGGFQSLGLSREIFSAIMKMGYKVPTPIQRKSLPVALSGRDIVAMARTGSGKTAAFLIPLLEKLGSHSSTVGARGLILSPTRELAQQTHKFAKQLGCFTSIRMCLLQGGDTLTAQFEALSNNPDIIVATPGRLMHLLAEVSDFSLGRIEVLVVDEADRIFEMGFAFQLKEILTKLPEQRQTLLFSATMPSQLAEFTRAGLEDPEVVRLDSETKLSENLSMAFFSVRTKEKMAALVHLVNEIIPEEDQTIVFTSTRHHVDYVKEMLAQCCNITCSVVYGSMDMEARQLNVSQFRSKKTKILIVTDIAARGIDIPLLNNVVNFDFPCKPKLFVHRVGRAARAGRSGTAYSFVTHDEIAYLLDLHLFLGRSVRGFDQEFTKKHYAISDMTTEDVDTGRFPQTILDAEMERVDAAVANSPELQNLTKVIANAHTLYVKTRSDPSRSSVRRAKELGTFPAIHPLFASNSSEMVVGLDETLSKLKGFRPNLTVFELEALKKGKTKADALHATTAMYQKRGLHEGLIQRVKQQKVEAEVAKLTKKITEKNGEDTDLGTFGFAAVHHEDENEEPTSNRRHLSKAERKRLKKGGDIQNKSALISNTPKEAKSFKDESNYIDAVPKNYDHAVETHLSINPSSKETLGVSRLEDALFDINPDESNDMASKIRTYHWDKRKRKYVKATLEEHSKSKRLRNEAGALVNSKMMKNRGELYMKWQKQTRKQIASSGAMEDASTQDQGALAKKRAYQAEKGLTDVKQIAKKHKVSVTANSHVADEIKSEHVIRKERKEKEKRRAKNARTPHAQRGGSGDKSGKGKKPVHEADSKLRAGESRNNKYARSRVIVKSPKSKSHKKKR